MESLLYRERMFIGTVPARRVVSFPDPSSNVGIWVLEQDCAQRACMLHGKGRQVIMIDNNY